MDDRSKAKLNRLLWYQRLRSIIPIVAISAVLLGLYGLYMFDQSKFERTDLQATVQSWSRAQTDEGSGGYLIWVELTDGTRVLTRAGKTGRAPTIGERVVIERRTSRLGRVSYIWRR